MSYYFKKIMDLGVPDGKKKCLESEEERRARLDKRNEREEKLKLLRKRNVTHQRVLCSSTPELVTGEQ